MKKRFLSALLALSMVLSIIPFFSAPAFALSGSGNTESDPILITSETDLWTFRNSLTSANNYGLGKYYALANDITFSNPATANWSSIPDFQGTFDGRNHTISGYNIQQAYSTTNIVIGFFQKITGATIKNLHAEGTVCNLAAHIQSGTGGLVAFVFNGGTIENCSFSGTVRGFNYMGGLVGNMFCNINKDLNIKNCWSSGTLIYDMNSTTNINGQFYSCSGIIGSVGSNPFMTKVNISNCFTTMEIDKSTSNSFGRSKSSPILGAAWGPKVDITDCYAYANEYGYTFPQVVVDNSTNMSNTVTYKNTHVYHSAVDSAYSGTVGYVGSLSSVDGSNSTYYYKSNASNPDTTYNFSEETATFFGDSTNFTNAGWDFGNTWVMNSAGTYPILRPVIVRSDKAIPSITYDDTADYTLSNLYEYLALQLDENYANLSSRFTFSIDPSNNVVVPEPVWSDTTYTYSDHPSNTIQLADIVSGSLVLNKDMPAGDYTIKVTATDNQGLALPSDITFNIRKKANVPAAAIDPLTMPRPTYAPSLTLDAIKLTDGWQWDNTATIPKNKQDDLGVNYYISTYDAYYQLDNALLPYTTDYKDYYDVSALGTEGVDFTYDAATNRIYVNLDPLVDKSPESPYVFNITVIDEDTGNAVPGAVVRCVTPAAAPSASPAASPSPSTHHYSDEFPKGTASTSEDTTAADGTVYTELSPGDHDIEVDATSLGYTLWTGVINVDINTPNDPPVIKIRKARVPFTVPKVLLKDDLGNHTTIPILGAKVTITSMTPSVTQSWNGGQLSMTADADTTLTDGLPSGAIFKLVNATYRYSTDEEIYVSTSGGTLSYWTDPSCTVAYSGTPVALYVYEMTEPLYTVEIDRADVGTTPYIKADIYIENIKATFGSFGLKYDKDVFTLTPSTDVVPDTSNIASVMSVEDVYSLSGISATDATFDTENGYYVFEWHTADANTVLDAEHGRKKLVTLTFSFKDPADADAASLTWFDIELWRDTVAAQAFDALLDPADPDYDNEFWQHWRDVTSPENDAATLGKGRIDRSKDVVNGVHKGGFFQASVSDTLGSTNAIDFYDVMTVLDYKIPLNNSTLEFHVFEQGNTSNKLSGAAVTIYNTLSPTFSNSNNTDPNGIARFSENTATGVLGPNFEYTVSCPGYWDVPIPGDPRPAVTAPTGVVTKVNVPMEKKIYHKPIVTNAGATAVQDSDLGGEKYAYNGRDFHFRAKAAKGYKIVQHPTKATVTIWDDVNGTSKQIVVIPDADGTYDVNHIFTLPATYITQQPLGELSASDIATLQGNDPNYADYITPQPDSDGFRSFNVYIDFEGLDVEPIEYIVEGVASDNGTVEYTASNPLFTTGLPVLTEDSSSTSQYRLVKTTKSPVNRRTGIFTFKADSGYMVERVYINGLRVHTYDNKSDFTYTFNEVDMDCNITVTFWNGSTPSNDSVMTLVVGDFGSVDVTEPYSGTPGTETGVTGTRRVYLKPTDDMKFETKPAEGDYLVYEVKQEVDTSPTTPVTPTATGAANGDGNKYSVSPQAGENVIVYVTFRHKDANPVTTPNRFVKSYVYAGEGVVEPAGILIYTLYDSVTVNQSTTSPFSAKGVVIQPFDDLSTVTSTYDYPTPGLTGSYTYTSLQDDIAIGSVFAEKAYDLKGIVDLGNGPSTSISTANCLSGAVVKFVRLEPDNVTEKPFQIPYVFNTTNTRHGAVFTASIPEGHWNVYVTKPGYVTYKIKDFPMTASTAIFGGTTLKTQTIVPYIGSAVNGKSVSLQDAAVVKSGWRYGVHTDVKEQADVDNDGTVLIGDISYVWLNYNKRMIVQDYSDFIINGSPAY